LSSIPKWFAAYTIPRREKHVGESLIERGIECFLPLYQAQRLWKKRSPVNLDLPLFPTYIFVRIAQADRALVLGIPGIVSIVGSPTKPWPLPDSEVETLRLGVQSQTIAPHPYLNYGDRVRIKTGLMAGVEGILTHANNGTRVVLTIESIMRSVAVEIGSDNIEMLDAALRHAGSPPGALFPYRTAPSRQSQT
jgi:transcription antitermination factor NusG